jgi:uncharacterized protein YciI
MDYVVIFEDDDKIVSKRAEFMSDHLAFLRSHAGRIAAAGPLRDAATGASAGGLWLVSAASCLEVETLVKADPFWPTGLRKSFRIVEWTKVHAVQTANAQANFESSSLSDGPSQIT